MSRLACTLCVVLLATSTFGCKKNKAAAPAGGSSSTQQVAGSGAGALSGSGAPAVGNDAPAVGSATKPPPAPSGPGQAKGVATKVALAMKTVEAPKAVKKVQSAAKAYFEANKKFPAGKTGWTPAKLCCEQPDKRCQPDEDAWAAKPWSDLKFQMSAPHYFQYRYRNTGTKDAPAFKVDARADLDCDGKYSHYWASGEIEDGKVKLYGVKITDQLE